MADTKVVYHEVVVDNPGLDMVRLTAILDMKSLQPYSTKDEYLYAMKEDLAEWLNSMYCTQLTAHNFIEQLKNGVLICTHANSVMKEAAFKHFTFNVSDLNAVGLINIASLVKPSGAVNAVVTERRFSTPSGKSQFAGEYLLYNANPKGQTMRAYDNITNFIKWCRHVVKVRECLMFETEDLALCKNEKNFILCLLEVARFGSRFGIQVPTIVQLEMEIEAEIALETKRILDEKNSALIDDVKLAECLKIENKLVLAQEVEVQERSESPVVVVAAKEETEDILDDSLNKSGNSFMEDFVPIDDDKNTNMKQDSKLEWSQSQTSSSGSQIYELSNEEMLSNKNENEVKASTDTNEDSVSNDSYVNDSLEFENNQEDQEITEFNTTNNNNNSYMNISQRPDRSEMGNSVNNTITAVTLINNNLNAGNNNQNQNSVNEITSSLTSFSSLSSSEPNSNSNDNANNKQSNTNNSSTTTSPSSTASSSPCKELNSSSAISLSKNRDGIKKLPKQNQLSIDCNIDHDDISISSPVYLSSPSSLESTPTDPAPAKDEVDSELNKEINEIRNSRVPIELNKSIGHHSKQLPEPTNITKPTTATKIPVPNSNFQTPQPQKMLPEFNDKYSHSLKPISLFNKPSHIPSLTPRRPSEPLEPTETMIPQIETVQGTPSGRPSLPSTQTSKDLHGHVCSIANKCTCEKKFLVDKIGEGKYKIGNTKNTVFIRILRNHIMVRVGGGWDTLENYLNKHDPCRCGPEPAFSKSRFNTIENLNNTDNSNNNQPLHCHNTSQNIILTPLKPTNSHSNHHQPNISIASANHNHNLGQHSCFTTIKQGVDYTNAQVIIERNNLGKHQVEKVILKSTSTQLIENNNNINNNSSEINNISNNKLTKVTCPNHNHNLNETHNTSTCMSCSDQDMTGVKQQLNSNQSVNMLSHQQQHQHQHQSTQNAMKHNQLPIATKYHPSSLSNSIQSSSSAAQSSLFAFQYNHNKTTTTPSKTPTNTSSLQKTESVLKSKMKKLIKKIPTRQPGQDSSSNSTQSPMNSPMLGSVRQKHTLAEPSTNPMYDENSGTPTSSASNLNATSSFYPINNVYTPTSKPAGLLKFQRTNSSTEAQSSTTTGYSSLNESSDYPETLSIYTETKLPPRLIRKYQNRARTEALIMNHIDATQSSSHITEDLKQSEKCNNNDTNSDTGSGSGVFSSSGLGSPISKAENDNTCSDMTELTSKATDSTPLIYQQSRIDEMFEKLPSTGTKQPENINSAPIIESLHIERIELNNEPIRLEEKSFVADEIEEDEHSLKDVERPALESSIESKNDKNVEEEEIKPLPSNQSPDSEEDEITETSEIIEYQTTLNGTIKNIQSIQLRANSKSPPPPQPEAEPEPFSFKPVELPTEEFFAEVFQTSSTTPQPKVPPRMKKRYTKKAQTEQLSRFILPSLGHKVSDADSLENDSIEEFTPSSPEPAQLLGKMKQPQEPEMVDSIASYLFKPLPANFSRPQSKSSSISTPSIAGSTASPEPNDSLVQLVKKTSKDLSDSLEMVNGKLEAMKSEDTEISRMVELDHTELNLEEDSLLVAPQPQPKVQEQKKTVKSTGRKRAQWDKSRSETPNEHFISQRAQWNKAQEEMDLMYYNFEMKTAQFAAQQKQLKQTQNMNSSNRSSSSKPSTSQTSGTTTPGLQSTPKKQRNLNLAKEKLYEMKLTLDSSFISDSKIKQSSQTQPSTPTHIVNKTLLNAQHGQPNTSSASNLTPRKVKKRSGERSVTTGLFSHNHNEAGNTYTRPQLNPTPLRSRSPHLTGAQAHQAIASTDKTNNNYSSLHNISRILNDSSDTMHSTSRQRTDSYTSTTSNGTFCSSFGQPNCEYKETKASELRKKTTLMNKINTKQHLADPIYTRSHPFNTELISDTNHNKSFGGSTDAQSQSSQSRKRLFAKRTEQKYDPNASMCSTGSSSSSSNNNQRLSRTQAITTPGKPAINYIKNNIENVALHGRRGPTKLYSRSKSASDLYYHLERTNSEQDLIELLNSSDAPEGDLNQYKIMMSETQKLKSYTDKMRGAQRAKKQSGSGTPDMSFFNSENSNGNIQFNLDYVEEQAHRYEAGISSQMPKILQRKKVENSHEKLEKRRSRSMSQFAIPDVAFNDASEF